MRKGIKLLATGFTIFAVAVLGGVTVYAADVNTGSTAALADTDYTVEEMLVYAIQDEYAAKAEYEAIIEKYGSDTIYTNILNAEENHILRLSQLFATYGYTIPANTETDVQLPESLEASYTIGVTAEENNIAMYEKFLKESLPSDVEWVFERLERASNNHLNTFENALAGNTEACINGTCTMQSRQGNGGTGCTGTGGTGVGRSNSGNGNTNGNGRGYRGGAMGATGRSIS